MPVRVHVRLQTGPFRRVLDYHVLQPGCFHHCTLTQFRAAPELHTMQSGKK
eukprot:COSAG02_NODE_20282_length_839_cov_3.083784_1_plen_50_part_01